ncbi:Cell division protein ZapE|nr:Cell division protein ZapE [Rhodococcus kroppenstedtii]
MAAAAEQGLTLDDAQTVAVARLETTVRHGFYLWGPPGRGKSWLMDVVFATARTESKTRTHWHRLLADLHAELHRVGYDLDTALDRVLGDATLLCVDEFHVHDPADGVLVGRLLDAVLRRDVTVLLTSNYAPRGLLPNPLFHSMIEPMIDRIEESLTIVHLDGPTDYRTVSPTTTRTGFPSGRWTTDGLDPPELDEAVDLVIGGRTIAARAVRLDLVWFTFDVLCDRPTAPVDYLVLAQRFPRWVVSGIPGPSRLGRDAAHRFGSLVDVLYDASIPVDFVAEVPLTEFLDSSRLPVDANRVASRLRHLRTTP